MIKKIIFLVLLSVFTININAQFKKVPKQYSFEAGYRNLFGQSNLMNKTMHGYGFLFDYAWQLSGFDGTKAASYITVPMGYTILQPVDQFNKGMSMLNYGWTVRHELKKKSDIMPFVGYGLFLNDLKIRERDGSVFGHQTQFEFGYDFKTDTRIRYFAKIQYSYTSYPQFDEKERIRLHYADLRIGIRF